MKKRILQGNLLLLASVAVAVGGTFLLDYLEKYTEHVERLEVVFGTAGVVMGFAAVIGACCIYTNGFWEGLDKD